MTEFLRKNFKLDDDWRGSAKDHLSRLPFPNRTVDLSHLEFLFETLPRLERRYRTAAFREVAEAFGWMCFQFWQAEAAFPSYSEAYAGYFRAALERGKIDRKTLALARVLLRGTEEGRCGFNVLQLSDVEAVREAERLKKSGHFEPYLKAQEKFDEFAAYLENRSDFRRDWEEIKAAFPRQVKGRKILRRSLVPERSWYQGRGAKFGTETERFQATFDVLCWKYYLWGVENDRPLLMKPTVAATPFGTQIFIPGYLSFDAKRDLDLTRIGRLHRARGAARQGPGFSAARKEEIERRKQAQQLDAEAKAKGLRGDARWSFIARGLGRVDSGDYREIRRLLEKRRG